MITKPQFLTCVEAGKELGVTGSRIRQLILAGRLKAQRLGYMWLIFPGDLEAVRDRRPGRPWHKEKVGGG